MREVPPRILALTSVLMVFSHMDSQQNHGSNTGDAQKDQHSFASPFSSASLHSAICRMSRLNRSIIAGAHLIQIGTRS